MVERCYDGEKLENLKKLLLYHKIVKAEVSSSYGGYLILDNGTKLDIIPNEGCSGCGSGNYYVDELCKCDNIITDVEIEYIEQTYDEIIRIFVFAGDERIKIIDIHGDEGNGYYGRGFVIFVRGVEE